MRIIRQLCAAVTCLLLLSSGFRFAAADVVGIPIFESYPLGDIGSQSGDAIDQAQYVGASFYVATTVDVTAVGGHLLIRDRPKQTLFAAIVALDGPTAVPKGNPFTGEELIERVVFTPRLPYNFSMDVVVPLTVTLDPGYYALIFGSGRFGAGGEGAMPRNSNIFEAGSPYFMWWSNGWRRPGPSDQSGDKTRFFVLAGATTGDVPLKKSGKP